jgi:hypothetical protein
MTPSGIEPANFQLVVQCHNQLHQKVLLTTDDDDDNNNNNAIIYY